MKRLNQTLCLFFLSLCFAAAQSTKGTLAGRVVDSSGSILQGARIQIDPTGITVASDAQGGFGIPDLPAGNYKVSVSYVGFDPYSSDIAIAAGETKSIEAR